MRKFNYESFTSERSLEFARDLMLKFVNEHNADVISVKEEEGDYTYTVSIYYYAEEV